jgi:hypothetical protein
MPQNAARAFGWFYGTRQGRTVLTALVACLLSVFAFWPQSAYAYCSVTDPGSCVQAGIYDFLEGIAVLLWLLNRSLLILAYQIGELRSFVIDTAFQGAYTALEGFIGPLLPAVAIVAIVLALLAFLFLPIIGRVDMLDIRNAITWVILAAILLPFGGQLVGTLEEWRVRIGTGLFGGAALAAPSSLFGASLSDGATMGTPDELYPACGLNRTSAAFDGVTINEEGTEIPIQTPYPDQFAAAMVWADGEDIHCPSDDIQGNPGLPDAWFDEDVGWAFAGNVGDQGESERDQHISDIQEGVSVLFMAIPASFLAVIWELIHFIFALCLAVLGLFFPITLLFVFFKHLSGGVTMLFRQAIGVLQVSWATSFVMGIITATLSVAANLGNAAAFAGLATGAGILLLYLLIVSLGVLKDTISVSNQAVMSGTGLSVTKPVEMAGDAAKATALTGVVAATGGMAAAAGAGALGASAGKAAGSGRFAVGSALGRMPGGRAVGEFARASGAVKDPAVLQGIDAGYRSKRSGIAGGVSAVRRSGEQHGKAVAQQQKGVESGLQKAAAEMKQAAQAAQSANSAQKQADAASTPEERARFQKQADDASKRAQGHLQSAQGKVNDVEERVPRRGKQANWARESVQEARAQIQRVEGILNGRNAQVDLAQARSPGEREAVQANQVVREVERERSGGNQTMAEMGIVAAANKLRQAAERLAQVPVQPDGNRSNGDGMGGDPDPTTPGIDVESTALDSAAQQMGRAAQTQEQAADAQRQAANQTTAAAQQPGAGPGDKHQPADQTTAPAQQPGAGDDAQRAANAQQQAADQSRQAADAQRQAANAQRQDSGDGSSQQQNGNPSQRRRSRNNGGDSTS